MSAFALCVEEEVFGAIWRGDKDGEIRRLRRELTRVAEERDTLKKATAYFARDAK